MTNRVGLGLRAPHVAALLAQRPPLALIEVHSENYFGGGAPKAVLESVCQHYALSLHGVNLSLGSVDPLNQDYLRDLQALIKAYQPNWVSDHLCFCSAGGTYAHDLLPLPYTEEALEHVVDRTHLVQEKLQRTLLIENVSAYISYPHSTLSEAEFLGALVQRTGCQLLLDVNNVYVSSRNLHFDPVAFLEQIDPRWVAEMHLAGYTETENLLVDTHNQRVHPPVWDLFAFAAKRFAHAPTVVEWDSDLPDFSVLLAEVGQAQTFYPSIED